MHSRRFRWVHFVPLIHLLVCLAAFSGYVIEALQPLGILVSIPVIADLPISILYGALAMSGQHDALALGCLVLAGTAWWYGLCRTAEKIAMTLRVQWRRGKPQWVKWRFFINRVSGFGAYATNPIAIIHEPD